jgi:hypothetical protein
MYITSVRSVQKEAAVFLLKMELVGDRWSRWWLLELSEHLSPSVRDAFHFKLLFEVRRLLV